MADFSGGTASAPGFRLVHRAPDPSRRARPSLFRPGNRQHRTIAGDRKRLQFPLRKRYRTHCVVDARLSPAGCRSLPRIWRFHPASFFAIVFLNALFSSGVCVAIFHAGKRVAGLGVASGAAWLWAIFPNAVIVPFEWVWDTSLSALLAATILW